MRRNRKQATGLAVSLFPFLAVLICTMGVLIVMLVLAVQSAAVKAQEAQHSYDQEVADQRDAILESLEFEQYRAATIEGMRPEVQSRLETARLERSHLDDEIRVLVEEARKLMQQADRLKLDQDLARDSSESTDEKIQLARSRIEARKQELDALRSDVAGRPAMYSIVPTRTANGTGRRPIYVECKASEIVLQPSGISINLDEFTKPILPGNPLDAALLATREHWNRFDAASSEGEPYPLIVVRPGGASAYAIARRAMTSWDDEFGYELVEAEKQLNWGVVDPNLKTSLQQAIAIARQRQIRLVDSGQAQWMNLGVGRMSGSSVAGGLGSSGLDPQAGSLAGATNAGFSDRPSGSFQSGSNLDRSQAGVTTGGEPGAREAGSTMLSGAGTGGIDTTKNDSLSRFADSRTSDSNSGNGSGGGSQMAAESRGEAGASGSASGNAAGRDPAALASTESADADSQSLSTARPLALDRGEGWALPTRTPGATPYRRPIRIDCNQDHYLVHTGEVDRPPYRIEIDESVDFAIDELVNQVWNQIEGWGLAEIGGFWKPVLRLSTSDIQGAARADELARKLDGSGLEIERSWR